MNFSRKIITLALLVASSTEVSSFSLPSGRRSNALHLTLRSSADDNVSVVGEETIAAADADTVKSHSEKAPAPKKAKKAVPHGKEGIFTPAVKGVKAVVGEEKLNKIRGKAIGMHSDVIKGFVATSDSEFGQFVLKQLFALADKDKNGIIDQSELEAAVKTLGFNFLKENQVQGIFERTDLDKNGGIDLEEFLEFAPQTLQRNLVKLAKNNGGELGFLS
eukprot:CAMPEP_0194199482 /NCGR_PEP_ID=MMETSP0156-20130528/485_1 /TAXON_ID=33649 /ORGANISM="Thalassionema nitzschioides, Strain L26-B" /LENGTH=218 /DNA_ID=CAMNT_0038924379 /DNA_START=88 /DNA_END=744 /DNA_ORIENTATION=+